jgi:sugar lactone lactonase YvrE
LTDERETGKKNAMFTLAKTPLLILGVGLAAILVTPARADRLFTGDDWGKNLYELDTSYGGWTKTVFSDQINCVNGLGTDGKGNLYESDFGSRTIRKFTPDGNYTVFANLDGPGAAITFDREGNLFIPFQWAGRIDKFTPDGSQRSVFATDLPQPVQVIFDNHGEMFVSDQKSGCIYEFDPDDATRNTFATGLNSPVGLLFDSHGILYVADPPANVIYKYTTNGVRTTFARRLDWPEDIAFDSRGNLFMSTGNGKIFEFKNKAGVLSKKPTLFATGMGHNYFMVILPGSMPTGILISKAMTLGKPWLPLVLLILLILLLLVVGAGFVIWLKRRKRRAVTAMVEGS